MLNTRVFNALPFPWALLARNGDYIAKGEGSLFKAFPELSRLDSMMHNQNAPQGWSKCPNGFATYCRPMPDGQKLVIYGLKVKGVSSISGKSDLLSINLEKNHVEDCIDNILNTSKQVDEQFGEIVRANLHEVRSLSNIIANAGQHVKNAIENENAHNAFTLQKSESVLAAQQLLYSRFQFFDFIFNPFAANIQLNQPVKVHNKFYKAVKTLEKNQSSRGVKVKMTGFSEGQIKSAKIFDIVPYLLIDNAVKYSPDNGTVDVVVEDKGNLIDVKIISHGPLIEKNEREAIFQKGYRAKSVSSEKGFEGTGVGLYVVQRIVSDVQNGNVRVDQEQDSSLAFNDKDYYKTTFSLSLLANYR